MNIVFISDLHLSDEAPALLETFKHFIHDVAYKADALFILGDLFETWVGDDDNSETAHTVARLLKTLANRGCSIEYIHGNRDFLLGEAYAKRCGMRLRPDPYPLSLDQYSLVLSHGDILCTQDHGYQRFRSFVQKAWVQSVFLALPRFLREKIARKLRKASSAAGKVKPQDIMDISVSSADTLMSEAQANILIHGHTHRPDTHSYSHYTRYVLGAWDIKPMFLQYNGSFTLKAF